MTIRDDEELSNLLRAFQRGIAQNEKQLLKQLNENALRVEALQKIFSASVTNDSYLQSVPYYLITGRYKADLYSLDGASLVTVDHPHKDGTVLVFPERNGMFYLTVKVLNHLYTSGKTVELARYQAENNNKLLEALNSTPSLITDINIKLENTLDWRYPAQTLSIEEFAPMKGKKFTNTRNKCNKVDNLNPEILPLIDSNPGIEDAFNSEAMNGADEIVKKWVDWKKNKDQNTEDDIALFYSTLLEMVVLHPKLFHGFAVKVDNKFVGFTIFDNLEGDVVNQLAGLSDTSITNLSLWQIHQASLLLQEKGKKFLGLGGSETDSLNNFKAGLKAVKSVAMSTLVPKYRDDPLVKDGTNFLKGIEHQRLGDAGEKNHMHPS